MNAILTKFQDHISLKAFSLGMGMVVFIYLGLFAFVMSQSDKTILKLEEKLASQSASIERESDLTNDSGEGQTQNKIPDQEGIALFPAPLDGLYEKNEHGDLLPVISKSKLSPFKAYKKDFSSAGKPIISIIVSDYGLSDSAADMVLNILPPEISIALSPYAQNADDWQKRARKTGHEVWMHLPMESYKTPYEDPGPKALLRRASPKHNQENINWVLSRTAGYAGIVGYSDGTFSNAGPVIQNMLKSLFARGLGYMELNPEAPPFIETIALSTRTPYARNNIFIETSSLKEIEKIATQYGYAIGILKPHPNSIKSVKTWIDTLPQKGFALAPVSAIAELNNQ